MDTIRSRPPSTSGKGDARRPGDTEKYREGWDRIFSKDTEAQSVKTNG